MLSANNLTDRDLCFLLFLVNIDSPSPEIDVAGWVKSQTATPYSPWHGDDNRSVPVDTRDGQQVKK